MFYCFIKILHIKEKRTKDFIQTKKSFHISLNALDEEDNKYNKMKRIPGQLESTCKC